jgi:hypothetical protein
MATKSKAAIVANIPRRRDWARGTAAAAGAEATGAAGIVPEGTAGAAERRAELSKDRSGGEGVVSTGTSGALISPVRLESVSRFNR